MLTKSVCHLQFVIYFDSYAFLNETLYKFVQDLYDYDNDDKYEHFNYMKKFDG